MQHSALAHSSLGNPQSSSTSGISFLHPESEPSLHGSEGIRYIPALDGLRCIAVLLVFSLHYLDLKIGWIGVDIFFVLSGFLITSILWRTRHHPHCLRSFYARRALRIFPLYYGVLFAVLFAAIVFQLPLDSERASWLLYLGNWSRYVHLVTADPLRVWDRLASAAPSAVRISIPIGHFWSLCVEEQFYLVWPACMLALKSRRRIVIACLTVVTTLPAMRFFASYLLPPAWISADALYHLTIFRVDALLLGALLAMLLHSGIDGKKVSRCAGFAFLLAFSVFAACALAAYLRHRTTSLYFDVPWIRCIGYSLIDIMAAGIIGLACSPGSILATLLSAKPLRWLGMRSYGFYVFHFLFLDIITLLVKRVTSSPHMPALAGLLFTLAITAASFRFYEQPFLRLKDRFPSIPSARPLTHAETGRTTERHLSSWPRA